jgi:hypothetical protein
VSKILIIKIDKMPFWEKERSGFAPLRIGLEKNIVLLKNRDINLRSGWQMGIDMSSQS